MIFPEVINLMAKTSDKAKNAWNARNYDSVLFTVKKGEKDKLRAAASAAGVSVSRFIVESINAHSPGLLTVLDDNSKRKKPAEE